MPRRSGATLAESPEHGQPRPRREIESGRERTDSVTGQDLRGDAVHAHGIGPAGHGVEIVTAVGEQYQAALAQHDVEIQLLRETLVEPQRKVVQPGAFRIQVIERTMVVLRPCCRRRSSRARSPRPADAVILGEIVGGGEPMAAAADDDDVVAGLGWHRATRAASAVVPTPRRAAATTPNTSRRGVRLSLRPPVN